MAVIVIESPNLSAEQKARIGERVITAMQHEGMTPGSIVVLFRPERGDIYLDGLLIQSLLPSPGTSPMVSPVATPKPPIPAPAPAPTLTFKTKARRSKPELEDLKQQLMKALQGKGSLSSFEAQVTLELKECDWAPATLRRLFMELEEAKLVTRNGQKRGTRYVWKGLATAPQAAPQVKLVKAEPEAG